MRSAIESPELATARQQLRAGAEGIGDLGPARRPFFLRPFAQDEAPADREPGLVGEQGAVGVAGDEAERVGMAQRRGQDVEDD